jgi:hypothetical protein
MELRNFVAEIENLQRAKDLLYSVWVELGPYTPHVSIELKNKLQSYHDFDDSE